MPHNPAASKEFFEKWNLYQKIIASDYMAHQGIRQALSDFVQCHTSNADRILDLGCGDASSIVHIFSLPTISHYTGVDLSSSALEIARSNLSALHGELALIERDFMEYLTEPGSNQDKYDFILIGFALHHLHTPEKQILLQKCRDRLANKGHILIYDVFRRPRESRKEYLMAYSQQMWTQWTALSPENIQSCADHITDCDFPETLEDLQSLMPQAGLSADADFLFIDINKFHGIVHCTQA